MTQPTLSRPTSSRPTSSRVDSFPYRHRVADVMTAPVVTLPPGASLRDAARELDRGRISSIIVAAGDQPDRALGIVTERDILVAIARDGSGGLETHLAGIMASPITGIPVDAFIYQAIGRMDRLGVRHLPALDAEGRLVGMITARALLKLRAGKALAIGDAISVADSPEALAAAFSLLPGLAGDLLAEGLSAREIAAVISGVTRDVTARAARLAGPPDDDRTRVAVLVLGSAGRGETLLAPDQDNAIIFAPEDPAATEPAWIQPMAARMADILNAAGVPYCNGGVMAREPDWRLSRSGWADRVKHWCESTTGANLLNADIFFDFQPVAGDRELASALRAEAAETASRSRTFLRMLANNMETMRIPTGLLGRPRSQAGRIDLKAGGLLPLVTGARVISLKLGITETGTMERLRAARDLGHLNEDSLRDLDHAHELVLRHILEQQIADIADGEPPGSRVAYDKLSRGARADLREAVARIEAIRMVARDVLTSGD